MATMKTRLEGTKAEVVRRMDKEVKIIKRISREGDGRDGMSMLMGRLYEIAADLTTGHGYSDGEVKRLLDICLYEAGVRRYEFERKAERLRKAKTKAKEE